MSPTIRNSSDLRAEIFRLERIEIEKGIALKARFNSPTATFSSVLSLFSNSSGQETPKDGGLFSQDFLGLISRFILPITLNRTIFRHSGLLVKTLVGVLSQKASHYISEDSLGSFWHKISAAFENHGGKDSGILGTIKSLFETKKQKKGVNHPANAPVQQNVLKTN